MPLEIVGLTPRVGTEPKTDIKTFASGNHGHEQRELLKRRGVLVERALHMTSEQKLAFSGSLGKVQALGQSGGPRGHAANPEDIISAALFLGSPALADVTGSIVPCDGGKR